MAKQTDESNRIVLLQGTLDMLILRMLLFGPMHGHGIVTQIQQVSEDVLIVDHGSLYPALQRLERRGLISPEWGVSDNNRKAKYYQLTKEGKKYLTAESSKWDRLTTAIARIMQPAGGER